MMASDVPEHNVEMCVMRGVQSEAEQNGPPEHRAGLIHSYMKHL